MPNQDHLEDVLIETSAELGRQLVEAYRKMLRNPDVAPKDYAIRLKEIIEESITKRPDDAYPGTVNN